MAIVVSVVVGVGIIAILWSVIVLIRRMFRGTFSTRSTTPPREIPPYGGLPDLGPVGGLGELSPDADIDDPASNSDDLYGE